MTLFNSLFTIHFQIKLAMVGQNPYLPIYMEKPFYVENTLVDLNDKGRAEEAKAALSEELRFKAEARRNKRVGLWFASEVLGLSDDQQQTFATDTMDADFEESGSEDVIRFLRQQAEKAGKQFDEAAVNSKMSAEYNAALAELAPK